MDIIRFPGAEAERRDRPLLVMLPAAHSSPSDFAEHGFPDALLARRAAVDSIAVDLKPDDYLDGHVAARLRDAVIAPEMARGRYTRLWLLGISLGGMGALLYARANPGVVDGIVLLAPFLATRGTIAAVTAAGGLQAWDPGPPTPSDIERGLLAWLRSRPFSAGQPRLFLGHGSADRYADASRLLYSQCPSEWIAVIAGGHDWPTWTALWHRLLGAVDFPSSSEGLDSASSAGHCT